MWSLGCVMAELALGWPLYPGSSEYDQIRYITETQGNPPAAMLNAATKTLRFFKQEPPPRTAAAPIWRLKTQEEFLQRPNGRSKETRKFIFRNLEDIVQGLPRPQVPDLLLPLVLLFTLTRARVFAVEPVPRERPHGEGL